MEGELLIAILAGLGGMLGWGLADFFAKKTINTIGEYPTLFWSQFIGIFPLLLLFFFEQKIPSIRFSDVLIISSLGLLDALSWIFLYKGFKKGEISLLSPVFSSYPAIAAIISAVLFAEIIPFLRWSSFGVILMGIILISLNGIKAHKKNSSNLRMKGFPEVLFAAFQFALWIVLWGNFLEGKSWIFYMLLLRIIVSSVVYFTCRTKKEKLFFKNKRLWKMLALIGLFDVVAYSLVTVGLSRTSYISIVAMLSGAFSLPTIFLARMFLKEKVTKIQTLGSIILISGIIFLFLT